nr:hypothetical protein [Tanacetum cinerariifolium]
MSDSEHSLVTYTSVPSLVEDYSDIRSPEVDRPPSPDYMPGPEEPEQAPLSPDYVPGPKEPKQAPPLPVYLRYVSELVYPEYMPPEDDVFLAEEQPLPVAATPTTDSPGYILEFDLKGDPEEDDKEDPEEDPADSTVPYSYRDSRELFTASEEAAFCFSTPSQEVGESSAAGAARQDEPAVVRDDAYSLVREELYGFFDRKEDKRWDIQEEIAKTFDHALKYGFAKCDNVTCIFPREGDSQRFDDKDRYHGRPRRPPGEFGREKRGAPADYQPAFN